MKNLKKGDSSVWAETSYFRLITVLSFSSLFLFGAGGCATPPQFANRDIHELHHELCFGPSEKLAGVSGSLWVKLEAKQGSAQFPSNILVEKGEVTIEVTDLFGGAIGVLTVKDGKFGYAGQNAQNSVIKDIIRRQNLFGLRPHEFSGIFIGKLPCMDSVLSARSSGDQITFSSPTREVEKFEVKVWGGKNLVKTMDARGLKLESSDYEDPYGLPKSWTIRSKLGTCNIRWRDRNILVNGTD